MQLKPAILAAIKWLQQNPDRHIVGSLAQDDKGRTVENVQKGTCFCALGRIAYEMGGTDQSQCYELMRKSFRPYNILTDDIVTRNDMYPKGRALNGNSRSDTVVIRYLQRLVKYL